VLAFATHHIDSIIQILVGLALLGVVVRGRSRFGPRTALLLKVCGVGLVLVGGILLFRPREEARWAKHETTDGVASADFPCRPSRTETNDVSGELSVKRTSATCRVPGKDITLLLSFSALPEAARGMTEAQLVDGTVAQLGSQGLTLATRERDASGAVHRLRLRKESERVNVQVALAYVNGTAYRAVAS